MQFVKECYTEKRQCH